MHAYPAKKPNRGHGLNWVNDPLPEFPSHLFENWAEHTSLAILVKDRDGASRWCNPAFTRMTLFAMPELLGRRSLRLLSGPLTEEISRETLQGCIQDCRGCLIRITLYRKDSSPFLAEVQLEPIRNHLGETVGFFAFHRQADAKREKDPDPTGFSFGEPASSTASS